MKTIGEVIAEKIFRDRQELSVKEYYRRVALIHLKKREARRMGTLLAKSGIVEYHNGIGRIVYKKKANSLLLK